MTETQTARREIVRYFLASELEDSKMAATQSDPTIEQLEEDLRRAVQLWGDDCSTAEALRKVIRELKKLAKQEERNGRSAQKEAK